MVMLRWTPAARRTHRAAVASRRGRTETAGDPPPVRVRTGPMVADVTIRPSERRDSPTLQEIELAAGARFRTVGMEAIADGDPISLDELDAYVAGGRSWVAVDDGDRPVGYVVVDDVDGQAHIEQVSVVPGRQGEGIGAALLDHVAAWAVAGGRQALTLTTFT